MKKRHMVLRTHNTACWQHLWKKPRSQKMKLLSQLQKTMEQGWDLRGLPPHWDFYYYSINLGVGHLFLKKCLFASDTEGHQYTKEVIPSNSILVNQ